MKRYRIIIQKFFFGGNNFFGDIPLNPPSSCRLLRLSQHADLQNIVTYFCPVNTICYGFL